jgi:predicted acylesterase/phospholipase RssA
MMRIVFLVAPSSADVRADELSSLFGGKDFVNGEEIELSSGYRVEIELFDNTESAMAAIQSHPVNVILIDNREKEPVAEFSNTMAGQITPRLLAYDPPGRGLNRQSVFVILEDFEATAHHAYVVGALQLGGVFVDPPVLSDVIESACKATSPALPGKSALCLAGGGIEGFYYEMGALRALDAHIVGQSLTEFDVFSGISAGAILGAFLANGVRPHEMSDALNKRPSRIAPIGRDVLFDPNVPEMASRVANLTGDLLRGRGFRKPLNVAMKVMPNAFFSGDKLKWHLEKELTQPGLTNDYNQLKKELFVGMTDQDSGEHIIFGEEGMRDVPISHTLRASAAMTPYYPPEKIKGRYYIDGIFTRTVNLDVAVAHGARLVVCIDPLTPMQVDQPGYVRDRGGFFNSVQTIKAMIRTRLSEVMGRAEEAYPNVALFVFSPTRQDLENMSTTMMRLGGWAKTEEMAFQSVSRQIQENYDWMVTDFFRHGFELRKKPRSG